MIAINLVLYSNFFSVLMKVNMSWTDRRIDFLHLRDDVFQNTVSENLRQKLWIPELGKLLSQKSKYICYNFIF